MQAELQKPRRKQAGGDASEEIAVIIGDSKGVSNPFGGRVGFLRERPAGGSLPWGLLACSAVPCCPVEKIRFDALCCYEYNKR